MKNILSIFALLFLFLNVQAQERYLLIIGTDTLSITADRQYIFLTSDGRELPIELKKQRIQAYESRVIKFQYPSDVEVSVTDLDEGVQQVTVLTEDGTGYFIQEFSNTRPGDIINLMMAELTKENIQKGYQAREETFEKILRDGKLLLGRKRTLTYKGNIETYTVASFGAQNKGILLVMVTNNSGNIKESQDLIQLLLETLEVK
jgi:hypothetical protein